MIEDGEPLRFGIDYFTGDLYPDDFAQWMADAQEYARQYEETQP